MENKRRKIEEESINTAETDTSDDDSEGVVVDDESSSDDSEIYRLGQKRSRSKKTTAEDFAGAMNRILSSRTKAADQHAPILSRSKGIERQINQEKSEQRARKAAAMEKKKQASKDRVKTQFTTFEHEKRLSRIATKGVVQLFNAIKMAQKTAEEAVEAAGGDGKLTIRQAKDVASMSKKTFLDILKSGVNKD
ncbi:10461_t:CDS:2 [Paraglomus brasilianum]|uniref:10461_t:CDS:1 n=1 Tax=Paraglomus brasilianum TaxID=144538 RepID=A0A9N9ABE3_9GLOM|nr:10461_t:CDS:2 [Paraglomus brasilianum]